MSVKLQIERACKEKGLSIKALAEKIEMTEAGIYAAFRNDSLKVSALKNISAVLNTPISVLMGEKEDKMERKKIKQEIEIELQDIIKIDITNKKLQILK
jgi:transcriptional regulator with XRE-family HTH domain